MLSSDTRTGEIFTLDGLVEAVGLELERLGLASDPADGRVSAIPDARAIRYYGTLGLVDRPAIVDRQARYATRHLRQVVAIKILQASRLPLAEIQARLFGRTDEELGAIIAKAAVRPRPSVAADVPERWIVIPVAPGIRLVVDESGFATNLPGDTEARLRAALESLVNLKQQQKEQR